MAVTGLNPGIGANVGLQSQGLVGAQARVDSTARNDTIGAQAQRPASNGAAAGAAALTPEALAALGADVSAALTSNDPARLANAANQVTGALGETQPNVTGGGTTTDALANAGANAGANAATAGTNGNTNGGAPNAGGATNGQTQTQTQTGNGQQAVEQPKSDKFGELQEQIRKRNAQRGAVVGGGGGRVTVDAETTFTRSATRVLGNLSTSLKDTSKLVEAMDIDSAINGEGPDLARMTRIQMDQNANSTFFTMVKGLLDSHAQMLEQAARPIR